MAHYAFLNNDNIVIEVIVGRDEDDLVEGVTSWEDYYTVVNKARCVQTSYNTRGGVHYDTDTGEPSQDQSKAFRKNYASMNFVFDENLDAFIPPKPNPTEDVSEWVLNEDTCLWEPAGA
jgi:hypothetical protein